ncbi:hypothetical protein JL720_1844 [Aureococcus anophagefferens]|nr:hypothetical protein JL720_1844 [Aureococcus anophagefferens]
MEVDATRIRRAEKKRAIERQRAEVAALRSRVAAGRGAAAPRPPPAAAKDDARARRGPRRRRGLRPARRDADARDEPRARGRRRRAAAAASGATTRSFEALDAFDAPAAAATALLASVEGEDFARFGARLYETMRGAAVDGADPGRWSTADPAPATRRAAICLAGPHCANQLNLALEALDRSHADNHLVVLKDDAVHTFRGLYALRRGRAAGTSGGPFVDAEKIYGRGPASARPAVPRSTPRARPSSKSFSFTTDAAVLALRPKRVLS